nr:hypothetical protein [Micromonospora sp. HK10]
MKAHRTDLVSFAFGLVFLALAVWWLLAQILGLNLPPVGWFLAGALILIGLLGLIGALRSGRHAGNGTAPQPVTTVAAPYEDPAPTSGVTGGVEADEWPGTAVTDDLAPAREDRPYGDEPRWSPTLPAEESPATRELPVTTGPAGEDAPATRELPLSGGPTGEEVATRELPAPGDDAPATRELPAVDGPAGAARTGGDESDSGERRPG